MICADARSDERGFVLYEALIALFLSLTMLGLFATTLATVKRASALDAGAGRAARVAAVGNSLSSWIESTLAISLDANEQQLFFWGNSKSLKFATLSVGEALPGGPNALEIFPRAGPESMSLYLRTWPLDDEASAAPPRGIRAEMLIDELVGARLAYFGAKAGAVNATWHDEWSDEPSLPSNISLSIALRSHLGLGAVDWNFRLAVKSPTSSIETRKTTNNR